MAHGAVGVEGDVGVHLQIGKGILEKGGALRETVWIVVLLSGGGLEVAGVLGETTTWLTPAARASRTLSIMPALQSRRACPGMESMGMSSSPSCTKMG